MLAASLSRLYPIINLITIYMDALLYTKVIDPDSELLTQL